ncbi:hypothetical protein JOB18_003258 [Solea senegalensis]|uniref:Uncharacterized protein n=1 Tax=Solea senegalensis TaxID=28829 RepID=A0AAV6RLU3_SOLSE|nr:hypothetical protein JOB18_003258 [Solea senegalensis]
MVWLKSTPTTTKAASVGPYLFKLEHLTWIHNNCPHVDLRLTGLPAKSPCEAEGRDCYADLKVKNTLLLLSPT